MENATLQERAERLVDRLADSHNRDRLEFASIHSTGARPGDVDAALAGSYRLHDTVFRLDRPIDWAVGPYAVSDDHAFLLNSFVFADPLLASDRNLEVVGRLAGIMSDWIAANPRGEHPAPHRYAWHDHAAAGRLVYMAFVLREGVQRASLPADLATRLAAGVLDHAEYLLDDRNYAGHNNHGMFSDAALALAARSLAPWDDAERWSATASARLRAVLARTISSRDALHLEHSPSYHWIVQQALSRFVDAGIFGDVGLPDLVSRMADSGAWLTAPDGTLPELGDTASGQRPPGSVETVVAQCKGMRAFRDAGYVAIREGASALLVTAAFHPTAHKHADDGSFCLYEDGLPIVTDSGHPGYDYAGEDRRYATSPDAHSTVCIDGLDWVLEGEPYGSGVVDAQQRDGVFTVLTVNPAACPGRDVRRLLVYRPAHFLVVIDDAGESMASTLMQYLPLAPDITVEQGAGGQVTLSRGARTVARAWPSPSPQSNTDALRVLSGRMFTRPGVYGDRNVLAASGTASAPRTLALTFGAALADRPLVDCQREGRELTARISCGRSEVALTATDDAVSLRATLAG